MDEHTHSVRKILLICKLRFRLVTFSIHAFHFIAVVLQYWAVWSIIRLYVPIPPEPVHFLFSWLALTFVTAVVWIATLLLHSKCFRPKWILSAIDERLGLKDTLITAWEKYNDDPSEWDIAIHRECCEHFNLKEFRKAFRFRIPGKACLMAVMAVGMFVSSHYMPYYAWQRSPALEKEEDKLRRTVERLEKTARGVRKDTEERQIVQRITSSFHEFAAEPFSDAQRFQRIWDVGDKYEQFLRTNASEMKLPMVMSLDLRPSVPLLGLRTTVDATDLLEGSAIDQLRHATRYAEELIEVLDRRSSTFVSLDDVAAENQTSVAHKREAMEVKKGERLPIDSNIERPAELPLSEKQHLTIGDLSIENQAVPWEKIPLWQEKVVKNYFSYE